MSLKPYYVKRPNVLTQSPLVTLQHAFLHVCYTQGQATIDEDNGAFDESFDILDAAMQQLSPYAHPKFPEDRVYQLPEFD